MAGFTRRFQYNPGTDVIGQIEGVDIIDLPAPGTINSTGVGVACIVGEFADMTYAVAYDGSGSITTSIRPQEIFSSADLTAKFGGFDETIGDFGASGGNGYVELKGKKFARLLVAPVNLCSTNGMRFFRDLPLNASATSTIPVVPVQGAIITAGREFRSASARVRVGQAVRFTANTVIASGIAGATVSGVSAATQVFNATAGFDWTTIVRPDGMVGAHKGDILVVGYNTAGAKTPTAEAGTYRVASDPSSGVAITVEKLDGSNFAFTTQSTVSWRLHQASDADSAPNYITGSAAVGGYAAADVGGYVVACRPLTNISGGATDGAWTASLAVAPVSVPTATTGSTWDPLGGLGGRTMPTSGIQFTAAVQGLNVASSATNDVLYQTAFDATLSQQYPISDINIIWPARTSATLRAYAKTNALTASQNQPGRIAVICPPLTTLTTSAALADSDPGVGGSRDERTIYTWPGAACSIPEAVGFRLKRSDGSITAAGILDLPATSWLASVLSILPPENNPGQLQAPIPDLLSSILGVQAGAPSLQMSDYIQMKARGICGLRIDRDNGPIFQSGVNTSLTSGATTINRRRMADYIQDNIARISQKFSKMPTTTSNKDNCLNEMGAFLDNLKSIENPANQRIVDYILDDKSANTPSTLAANQFYVIGRVQTLPTMDAIVFQAMIGPNVSTVTSL